MNWLRNVCYRLVQLFPAPLVRFASVVRARYPRLKRWLDWPRDLLRDKDGVISHGAAKGLLFNTGSSNVGFLLGSAEPEVQKVFQLLVRVGSVVYDIGANVGFFTLIAARLSGPSGRVFAFEPVVENFKQLERNAGLNGLEHIEARNVAVADHDGTAQFLLSKSATFGGLATTPFKIEDKIGTTEVEVRRLDGIVQDGSLPLPHLIKIDVEGAEAEVLDGALETIRNSRPVLIIELHATNVAISERLKSLNYFPVVLGSENSVADAHWNARVVAFPALCPELTQIQNGSLRTA